MYIEERCEDIARHSFQPPIDLRQEKKRWRKKVGRGRESQRRRRRKKRDEIKK